jgi:hypothetical protein
MLLDDRETLLYGRVTLLYDRAMLPDGGATQNRHSIPSFYQIK